MNLTVQPWRWRVLPLLLILPLLGPACMRRPPAPESRTLVENVRLASTQPPGGLTLNLELEPARDYVLELRGRLEEGVPTLRVDQEGSNPSAPRYLAVAPEGLVFRVRSTGRLRLMIYQDAPFRYLLDSLRLRTAEPADTGIPDIFDADLPATRYTLPLPR